jgi:hypothetical protein
MKVAVGTGVPGGMPLFLGPNKTWVQRQNTQWWVMWGQEAHYRNIKRALDRAIARDKPFSMKPSNTPFDIIPFVRRAVSG